MNSKNKRLNRRPRLIGVIAASAVIFALLALGAGRNEKKEIKAAIENAYPAQCLGGWQNPNNASGYPEASGAELSETNAATLRGQAAQIFCGSFAAEEKTYPPKSVTLKFAWKIDFPAESTTTVPDPDAETWKSEIQENNENPLPPAEESQLPAEPIPSPPPSENPPSSFFVSRAFAEDATVSSGDILEISYSLDGQTWESIGRINGSNWANFSATIPLTSWDEVERLQVQLNPLPSAETPTVYLDGMWLEVDYDKTISDTFNDGTDAVFDFTSTIGEVLDGAVDAVVETVTEVVNDILTPETLVIVPEENNDKQQQPPPVPEPAKKQLFEFSVKDTFSGDVKNLQWLPSTAKKEDVSQNKNKPDVSLVNGKEGFLIEGRCDKEYYVILLFRNKEDYQKDPSSAVFNKAGTCVNGLFSTLFDGNDLPPNLEDGVYYLLTADQGTKGPWTPHSEMREITINRKTATQ